jgi:hypothetical protein
MFYLAIKLSILATLHNLAFQTVLSATLMQQLTMLTALAVAILIALSILVSLFINFFYLLNK